MRVIIHSDEYYPMSQACSYRMQVFSDMFREKGHEVTVITSSANLEGKKNDQSRMENIIYAPTIKMRKKTTVMRMMNNLSFAVSSVFAAMKAGKADVVITTSPPPLVSISGWIIARMKHAKLVYDVRDIWPDVALEMGSFRENSFFCKIFRKIAKFMYQHADMITTVSPGKVEKLRGYIPVDDREKVHLVGNGYDRSIAQGEIDEDIVQEYELETKPTCVYIGNIGHAQGLDIMLKIAAQTKHKEVQFLLFGKGAEKEALEQQAKEEGLENVRFCGVLDHSKVYTVLKKVKCSIIPLKNAQMKDSVPTKIYEALGLGCPVFLIANGDASNLVQESRLGVAVSPDCGEEIISAFDAFLDQYDAIALHAGRAQELMDKKYARQTIAADFEQRLRALCENQ